MGKVITEITSYCGDVYQKVELAHSTFYHRIKKKGDIAFLPSTNSLSLAVTEVDRLRAEVKRLAEELGRTQEKAEHFAESLVSNMAEVERLNERIKAMKGVWAYEQACSLCGSPMFSDEPMIAGEVHGTCETARSKGLEEAAQLTDSQCGECSSRIRALAETVKP